MPTWLLEMVVGKCEWGKTGRKEGEVEVETAQS
jgi:hypothetical protein